MSATQRHKFLRAAAVNDIRTVAKLLQQAAVPVDVVGPDGDTALTTAIKDGNVSMVQLLLKHGADADFTTLQFCEIERMCDKEVLKGTGGTQPFTPLQLACSIPPFCTGIVKALLDAGADPRPAAGTTMPALHLAAVTDATKVTQLLLTKLSSEDIDSFSGSATMVTPLMAAVQAGQLQQVQLLLRAGASVHVLEQKGGGKAALHMAAMALGPNCAGIIEALVQAGASVHLQNSASATPLVMAVQADNAVAVKMLLASGSNAKITSPLGGASLLVEALSLPVFKLLLDAGLNVNACNDDGMRVLHSMVVLRKIPAPVPVICAAIKAGADLKVKCGGRTAAELAAAAGNVMVAQLLIRAAKDVK
jgi:ankyrin repeat protein